MARIFRPWMYALKQKHVNLLCYLFFLLYCLLIKFIIKYLPMVSIPLRIPIRSRTGHDNWCQRFNIGINVTTIGIGANLVFRFNFGLWLWWQSIIWRISQGAITWHKEDYLEIEKPPVWSAECRWFKLKIDLGMKIFKENFMMEIDMLLYSTRKKVWLLLITLFEDFIESL